MSAGILLAVVLGAGQIPIASSVTRFPDPSSWPGYRGQQVANMLAEIARDAAPQLRTIGPGPAQLAARWKAGQLNEAERVAVLLGAGTYHDLVVLPLYREALLSPALRERQAAIVGLAWLIGDPPPDPTRLTLGSPVWKQAEWFVGNLEWQSRTTSLVRIWVDSYLAANGMPLAPGHHGIDRTPEQCLAAIRNVAQPEDLSDLVALWPMLDRLGRLSVLGTIETITVQRLRETSRGPRGATGDWTNDRAVERLGTWVNNNCTSVSGLGVAGSSVDRAGDAFGSIEQPYGSALAVLLSDYPSLWPVPAEALVAYGAPAVAFDLQSPDNPYNSDVLKRVRDAFPLTTQLLLDVRARSRMPQGRRRR